MGEIIMPTLLTWSVKIETVGGRTVFTLNPGPGPNPGPNEKLAPAEPFTAQIGDGVSWRNDTPGVAHMIWRTDGDGGAPIATVTPGGRGIPPSFDGLMSDPIAPDTSSSRQYFINTEDPLPATIYYCCLLHPNEKGSIKVIDHF
jgi:hypothetical protein